MLTVPPLIVELMIDTEPLMTRRTPPFAFLVIAPDTLAVQSTNTESLSNAMPLLISRHPPFATPDPVALEVQPLIVEPLIVIEPLET